MLQLQWESQQPFSFAIILQFRLLASCLSWSFLFLYHILLNLLILPCLIIVSFFTLSTTAISGLLASIMWSYCMVKSERAWNFCFQLHFLSHVHTKSLLYWILASHKTAIIHIFLHYHAFVCTPFRQVCHIHSPYQI